MRKRLHISLFGPLRVMVGGETAVFRTDAERVLLAYLAAHHGIPQRRDTLAGLLSPDRPDKEALTYLRNRLTRLRQALGDEMASPPWLEADRKQITLRRGADIGVDLSEFERLLTLVETHHHRQLAGCPTCVAHLETAVGLTSGELLAGLNFPSETWEGWLLNRREHLQARTLEAMTWLREAQLARGEWRAVLAIAQQQLSLEPWLEAAHRALMQAHVYLGDRNAALAQFDLCQQLLWDDLGVGPEEETITLFERIKAENLPAFALSSLSIPNNLPLQTTRFFGREAEQTFLLQRLVDPSYRLITLVGTGGIGKTRLAVEVGQQVKMSFPDGVWFVPLGAVKGGAEQIKIAVGEAIGLGQAGKQLTGEQVLAILRDKRTLLIFDNCESVLDDLGFMPEWLRRGSQLAILATSRAPLNFEAEAVVGLSGLPTGGGEMSTAEALFAERGQIAWNDFVITAENLPDVRQICELVDGSPLGIALAAAWVRRRSLPQILAEIGRSLDFLSTRLRDVDPRHRSMRAVFETSWQLLEPDAQTVLAALSAFPTSFTAAAAAAIAGATPPDLDLLCEKSLLQQQHEAERYVLHSLVRQFAAEKLSTQAAAVDRAFINYFFQFAHEHQADYTALQPEWSSFLAALVKAHAQAAWQMVLDFVRVLDEPWFRQIRFNDMRQGRTLALAAARALADQPTLAWTLLRLGEIETELNAYAAAEAHLAEAMPLLKRLEDNLGIAEANYLYGRIRLEQAQDEAALALFTDAMGIFEEEEAWLGVAKNLNLMALCAMKQSPDFQVAHAQLERSVALQRHLPPSSTYIEALRYLGRIKGVFGDYAAAEACLSEAAEVSRAAQDIGEYAAVLYDQIVLCRRQNQIEAALQLGVECLTHIQLLGSQRWEALVKTQLAILHQTKQNHQQSLTLFQDGLQIYIELGDLFEQAYSHYYLFKLYDEIGQTAQSLKAKQQAIRLNAALNDPYLKALLE